MKSDKDLGFMYNDRYIKGFSNSPRHKPSKRIKLSFTTQIASTWLLLSHWLLPDLFMWWSGKSIIWIIVQKSFGKGRVYIVLSGPTKSKSLGQIWQIIWHVRKHFLPPPQLPMAEIDLFFAFQTRFCLARILTLKTIRIALDCDNIFLLLMFAALLLLSLAPSSTSSYQFPSNLSSSLSGKELELGKIKPSWWVFLQTWSRFHLRRKAWKLSNSWKRIIKCSKIALEIL